MHAHLTSRCATATALVRRPHRLDGEINIEMKQSVLGHLQVSQLKRSKQRLKVDATMIEGTPMTVHRTWVERRKN